MKKTPFHAWDVSPREALRIQEELRKKIRLRFPKISLKRIAAGDVAYGLGDASLYGAFLLFSFPGLVLLEKAWAKGKASFPYVPGLLTFREAPILLKAFDKLKAKPDLILLDGQGIAHPRGLGIAAHLGLLLDLPAIGCAKRRLIGTHGALNKKEGSAAPLVENGQTIGMVLRTRAKVKPVFVSAGHKIDLKRSVQIVLALCRGYRIPEPLRQAHLFVNSLRRLEAG